MHLNRFVRGAAPALAALLFAGCFSVETRRKSVSPAEASNAGQTGGVALRVYADDELRKAGRPGPRGLYVELERRDGKVWEPVFRSLEPAWSVLGLPPGDYRLQFPSRLDERGEPVALDESPRKIRVRAGEVTEVDAILEHVDKGLIVAGVVAAVVATVLLHDWLDDVDIPLPPIPPPPVVDAIFWITLDLATMPDGVWSAAGSGQPPVVTSHFPPDDALVAARWVKVTFSFSEPLDETLAGDGCIEVEGRESGPLSGATSYDAERWWLTWSADEDLPRDERFVVTLRGDCVVDRRGLALPDDESFSFRTSP
jgi:hypothetical protein